jgi:ABC-2 type transport system permease protein
MIMMPLFVGGGYLLQGLAQEKENRVLEMLLVSLRPSQLLAGKLLGLGALTIVQFASWLVLGGLTMKIAGEDPLSFLQAIDLSGSEPILVAAFAGGGFLLYATLMGGLGAVAPNVEATRMWSFVVSSPMLVPIFLSAPISMSPNGALAVLLSILPFSSPIGMLMRLMATAVAPWEIAFSLALLIVTAILMVLVMSRIFRASTLLSGQPLSLRRFWDALQVG